MSAVLHFDTIGALHEATGFTGRTDLPGVHVLPLEAMHETTRDVMPPYTLGFYAAMLFTGGGPEAVLDMNAQRHALADVVAFQGPGHVTAWARRGPQQGFAAFFHPEFLASRPAPPAAEFPFFRPTEVNVLAVEADERASVRGHFDRLHEAFRTPHPYRADLVRSLLLALLIDARRVYDRHRGGAPSPDADARLAARFQLLIGQRFRTHKTVKAYAALLGVTPNHLSAAVAATLGRPARAVIADRLVAEAKTYLRYTDLTAAEIAFRLGFSEPTHLGRFFKRETGLTPHGYRTSPPEAVASGPRP